MGNLGAIVVVYTNLPFRDCWHLGIPTYTLRDICQVYKLPIVNPGKIQLLTLSLRGPILTSETDVKIVPRTERVIYDRGERASDGNVLASPEEIIIYVSNNDIFPHS